MQDDLRRRLTEAGQQHLLDGWDKLEIDEQQRLARQIDRLDLDLIRELSQSLDDQTDWAALAERATSPRAVRLDGAGDGFTVDDARRRGEEMLRSGRAGALLVAGGQGTRLGFPHPKGMFPVGPVSGRTLFEMFADQLLALERRYGVQIPLYLMTSPATHAETEAYFQQHANCGLAPGQVTVFCQGTMPAVDAESGDLLRASADSLALSPDGHGGTLAALVRDGYLVDAQRRGVQQLFYFQVDNPLVKICDPVFLGCHLLSRSEMSTQAVAKQDPAERVGVVVSVDDREVILEYSDLPADAAARTDRAGGLALWAGNTAIHVFDVAFLDRVKDQADALPFHRANKAVPYYDAHTGRVVEPDQPNAVKYERFIFDLMPHAKETIVMEVDPAESFAPVKNASGEARDTPQTARTALVARARRWLTAAGAAVADGVDVEISPLLAVDAEELRSRIEPGLKLEQPTFLQPGLP